VAKSHTSWMNFKDNREFQDIERNPFNFQYVKAISTFEEYRQMAYTDSDRLKPIVVITSTSSLSQGFAKQILKQFAARDQNEIIFIERAFTKDSVAANLFKKLKVFPMEEIRAVKPISALSGIKKNVTEVASVAIEPVQAAILKTKDPRKTALMNKATSGLSAEKKPTRKGSIEELVNETINTKTVGAKNGKQKAGHGEQIL